MPHQLLSQRQRHVRQCHPGAERRAESVEVHNPAVLLHLDACGLHVGTDHFGRLHARDRKERAIRVLRSEGEPFLEIVGESLRQWLNRRLPILGVGGTNHDVRRRSVQMQ